MAARGADDLEDAFIGYMADADGPGRRSAEQRRRPSRPRAARGARSTAAAAAARDRRRQARLPACGRMLAYSRHETLEILRDPVRLAFAFVGSALLMLVFGFGITTDVENIRFASLDLDQSPESRAYLEQFEGSRVLRPPPAGPDASDEAGAAAASRTRSRWSLEIPPNFGRDLRSGDAGPRSPPEVDGANPFRGRDVAQYVEGVHNDFAAERSRHAAGAVRCRRPRSRSQSASSTTRRSRASTRSCPACRPSC